MAINEFQLEVLGHVANDYEAVHTIRGDMERELARPVSAEEVGSALIALTALGLVDSYIYNSANSKYQRAAAETNAIDKLWFLVSEVGRLKIDRD